MARTIIIEGPDGSGKSTLAEFLSRWLGRPVLHTGGPKTTIEELEAVLHQVEQTPDGLFDRCPHISNPIYSKISGRDGFIHPALLRERLVSVHPILIYCCLSNRERMLQGISEAKKDHKPQDHLNAVKAKYFQVASEYDEAVLWYEGKIPVLYYSYEDDKPQDILSYIRRIQSKGETC